jgi:hypothetical protein
VDAKVAPVVQKLLEFEFYRFTVLAIMIPREMLISSKIDRGAVGGVDGFEDGFTEGRMRVNCR